MGFQCSVLLTTASETIKMVSENFDIGTVPACGLTWCMYSAPVYRNSGEYESHNSRG